MANNKIEKRIGFTCSSFDLCHPGHVAMLEECKRHCDYLIVGLQVDPTFDRPSKNKPIQTVVERYMLLRGSKYVDEIVPYQSEKDLESILSMFYIDIRFLGVEYIDKEFTGKSICVKRSIKLFFNTRDHSCSSTDLRNRIVTAEHEKRFLENINNK